MRHRFVSACQMITAVCFLLFAPAALFAQTYVSAFPQFASGDGWSSDIFIANQGSSSATVALSFYGDHGDSLTVDSSLGTGSTFSITLNGGNTIAVRVGSSGPLRTGYALFSFPSGASVRASEVFRYVQNGVVVASLGVAQQFASATYSFPAEVDVARGVNTAVAIANGSFDSSGSIAQSFVVSLIRNDDNGLFFQSDSFIQAVLPADGTYYFAVTDAQGRGGPNGYYRLHVQSLTPPVQGDASKFAGPGRHHNLPADIH
jgi:hypothetical protein